MKSSKIIGIIIVCCLSLVVIIFIAGYTLPWHMIHWGTITYAPSNTVTVIGTAKTQVTNQKATFSAGVNSVKDNRDDAISEVNKKLQTIIDAAKGFGIIESDIKTQSLNIYQSEESYYEDGRQKSRLGQWRVSNTVDITLRNVSQASDLSSLLIQSGANNVYGPNFSLEDTEKVENDLLQKAVTQAKEKAVGISSVSGKSLGKILSIAEGNASTFTPFYKNEMGGGGGAPTEAGSSTVEKTVTVTFELK